MSRTNGCWCCVAGHSQRGRICTMCFMIWYDSGITEAPVLAREARWRKSEGFWPWGERQPPYWAPPSPTLEQIAAMEQMPLPDLEAEKP